MNEKVIAPETGPNVATKTDKTQHGLHPGISLAWSIKRLQNSRESTERSGSECEQYSSKNVRSTSKHSGTILEASFHAMAEAIKKRGAIQINGEMK